MGILMTYPSDRKPLSLSPGSFKCKLLASVEPEGSDNSSTSSKKSLAIATAVKHAIIGILLNTLVPDPKQADFSLRDLEGLRALLCQAVQGLCQGSFLSGL